MISFSRIILFFVELAIVGLFLLSCQQAGSEQVQYIIEPITNDSILVAEGKNGETCWYKIQGGQKQGSFTCFYANGYRKAEGELGLGKLDGIVRRYFENGSLRSTEEFIAGRLVSNRYLYDSLGNITNYQFIDSEEVIVYEIEYQDERRIREIGELPIFVMMNDTSTKANEPITIQTYLGQPSEIISYHLLSCAVIADSTWEELGLVSFEFRKIGMPIISGGYVGQILFPDPGSYLLAYSILKRDSSFVGIKEDTMLFVHQLAIRD